MSSTEEEGESERDETSQNELAPPGKDRLGEKDPGRGPTSYESLVHRNFEYKQK